MVVKRRDVHRLLRRLSSWCFAALLCMPAVTRTSPAILDSVLHCEVLDEARWEATPVAGKHAAELNVGEPRTVRMIYFLPSDRPYRQSVVDTMKSRMVRMRRFFGEQMESHGYGYMTFRYESDAAGDPVVHRLDGEHANGYYHNDVVIPVSDEVLQAHNPKHVVLFVVIDSGDGKRIGVGRRERVGGVGTGSKSSGMVWVPGRFGFKTGAHELGHAFGMLWHDYRDGAYIMTIYGGGDRLSACSAAYLSLSPFFNPDVPLETDWPSRPTIELLSPVRYPAGTERIAIRLKVAAPHGLHHLIALVPEPGTPFVEVYGCRDLSGEQVAKIEYEYDGVIPSESNSRKSTSLSDPPSHTVKFVAMDRRGDQDVRDFHFAQRSPYHLATLEGHTDYAPALAVSPHGTMLASGSSDMTVKLWDTKSREEIATLDMSGPNRQVQSLAFSPDGSLLAAGTFEGGIALWDVASRKLAGTLEGHTAWAYTLAFSADGGTLVSGSLYDEDRIKVWDVATRQLLGVLGVYTKGVRQVAFSPDGRVLASCSFDGTIRIWDLEALKERNRLVRIGAGGAGISSIAFSPDGKILAADGSIEIKIALWDWAAQRHIADLPLVHGNWINHMTFSPDGESLATAGAEGTVIVRDVATGRVRQRFPHVGGVESLAYWPDGSVLAAVSDGLIELWDTSEWVRRRPDRVALVSGQGQQGVAGKALPAPFVASVLDQDGAPFPGIPVLFAVTGGGGAVSATAARADTSGRAATTLTLGAQPGVHTVAAQAIDLAPAVFTARAVGSPDVDGDGAVDFEDFVVFAGKFGTSRGRAGYDARCDLDGDGTIGFSDFVIFAGAFGQTA